jgi:hypothetical protein
MGYPSLSAVNAIRFVPEVSTICELDWAYVYTCMQVRTMEVRRSCRSAQSANWIGRMHIHACRPAQWRSGGHAGQHNLRIGLGVCIYMHADQHNGGQEVSTICEFDYVCVCVCMCMHVWRLFRTCESRSCVYVYACACMSMYG